MRKSDVVLVPIGDVRGNQESWDEARQIVVDVLTRHRVIGLVDQGMSRLLYHGNDAEIRKFISGIADFFAAQGCQDIATELRKHLEPQ